MRRGLAFFLAINLSLIAFLIYQVSTLLTLLVEDASADAIHSVEIPAPNSPSIANMPQLIPKIIHQTYVNESTPEIWREAQQSCIDLHEDYEYRVCQLVASWHSLHKMLIQTNTALDRRQVTRAHSYWIPLVPQHLWQLFRAYSARRRHPLLCPCPLWRCLHRPRRCMPLNITSKLRNLAHFDRVASDVSTLFSHTLAGLEKPIPQASRTTPWAPSPATLSSSTWSSRSKPTTKIGDFPISRSCPAPAPSSSVSFGKSTWLLAPTPTEEECASWCQTSTISIPGVSSAIIWAIAGTARMLILSSGWAGTGYGWPFLGSLLQPLWASYRGGFGDGYCFSDNADSLWEEGGLRRHGEEIKSRTMSLWWGVCNYNSRVRATTRGVGLAGIGVLFKEIPLGELVSLSDSDRETWALRGVYIFGGFLQLALWCQISAGCESTRWMIFV